MWRICTKLGTTRLALSLLLSIGTATAASAESAVELNNEGVTALKTQDFPTAISKLKEALVLDPTYRLARNNLAIACNNYGLSLRDEPKKAVHWFHQAFNLDPDNKTTQLNLEGIIKKLGRDPKNFYDRVGLGDQASKDNDAIGAAIEYKAALALKDDPEIKDKLAAAQARLESEAKLEAAKVASAAKASAATTAVSAADCAEKTEKFLMVISELGKSHWVRPPGSNSKEIKVQVIYTCHPDGRIDDAAVGISCGDSELDQSAVKALTAISGMMPPPQCLKEGQKLGITFVQHAGKK